MLAVRVIPCLDVDAGRVVKGVRSSRSVTPAIRSSSRRATTRRAPTSWCSSTSPRRPTIATRWCTSSNVLPTRCSSRSRWAAGSVRSKTSARMLRAGADKVSLNTAAVNDPDIIRESADEFGDQCIVVAIDAAPANAEDPGAGWEVVTHGGRTATEFDAVEWAVHVCDLGAGEILLTSMDRDGTKVGYDIDLLRAVGDAVSVPLIASGGVGTLEHLCQGATEGGATRSAGRLHLPLRPTHRPGSQGAPDRERGHGPALIIARDIGREVSPAGSGHSCSMQDSACTPSNAPVTSWWFRAAPSRCTVTEPSAGLGARHGARESHARDTRSSARHMRSMITSSAVTARSSMRKTARSTSSNMHMRTAIELHSSLISKLGATRPRVANRSSR